MNRSDLNRLRVKLLKLNFGERMRFAGWLAWLAMGLPKPTPSPTRAFDATLDFAPKGLTKVQTKREWRYINFDMSSFQEPIVIGEEQGAER